MTCREPRAAKPTEAGERPHYIILNLAVGGTNGGDPAATEFSARYEIDCVRLYREVP